MHQHVCTPHAGIIPGFGGTQRLPRLVGVETAARMMLTSKPISGKEALKKGLVDAVEAADKWASHQLMLRSVTGNVPLHWRPCSVYSGQGQYPKVCR